MGWQRERYHFGHFGGCWNFKRRQKMAAVRPVPRLMDKIRPLIGILTYILSDFKFQHDHNDPAWVDEFRKDAADVALDEVANGKEFSRLTEDRPTWVSAVAFSPDGRYAAIRSEFDTRLFPAATGKELWGCTDDHKVYRVVFSPTAATS